MKQFAVFLLVLSLASLFPASPLPSEVHNYPDIADRGIYDFVINTFGLSDVWSLIQDAGSNVVANFLSLLTQIVFRGQETINQAKPIIAELVKELRDRTVSARQAIFTAISELTAILGKPTTQNRTQITQEKSISDWVINLFGLSGVWDQIQALGAEKVSRLVNLLIQIAFRGITFKKAF
jgi:hypothetical protein